MDDAPTSVRKRENPTGEVAVSDPEYDIRRRLVVCLDGTWNSRDSGTNIYHLSNLVKEGAVGDPGNRWFQMVHYDEGVGTGVLTSVRGGAFGIGLSENVREAYDWLVEKYRDGDEIYIFGFSRGAFTARSLVGLLAKCGLLYRGAPISPAQLWRAYRILGRHSPARDGKAPAAKGLELIKGRAEMPFRPLRTLKRDSWESPDASPPPAPPQNRTEQLLLDWSRRVPVTCLGVFDTVASMGLDALSIPWLRDRTAQFHDTKLSSLVVNGLQALAIDENRANFAHVSWHRALNFVPPAQKVTGKVEQRWFVGAHANVGGGYEDDLLSQFSLAWFMEECEALGLVFRRHLDNPDPATPPLLPSCIPLLEWSRGKVGLEAKPPPVRDSYAEIARGVWKNIIRSKRHYRHIAPPPESQNGTAVQSVNEGLDESVLKLMELDCAAGDAGKRYDPPNLWEYRQRTQPDLPAPRHRYLEGRGSAMWLAIWLVLAGGAWMTFAKWRGIEPADWLALAVMAGAWLLDWTESRLNHAAALRPGGLRGETRKAFATFLLFLRVHIFLAILISIVVWLTFILLWIVRLDLTPELKWLIGLYAVFGYCLATASWCRAPTAEAGFGSITQLQAANSPAKVLELLRKWAAVESIAPASKETFVNSDAGGVEPQLLMPVAHTIWRDMLAYIPAYSLAIFLGAWLFFSLLWRHFVDPASATLSGVVLTHSPALSLAVFLALAVALFDYIEDIIHLTYLRVFPRAPAGWQVALAYSATVLKFLLFVLGAVIFFAALGWLTWMEAPRIWTDNSGAVRALVVVCPALLAIGSIFLKLRSRKNEPEVGNGETIPTIPKQAFAS